MCLLFKGGFRQIGKRPLTFPSIFYSIALFSLISPYIAKAGSYPMRGQTIGTIGGKVEFGGAAVSIPENALRNPLAIAIERLSANELPPLEPGMINVTKGSGGYRFLPAGTKFSREVRIELPLEDSAPELRSTTAGSARTYFWDETNEHWVPLKRLQRVDEAKIISNTKHFTIMINAVLTAPEHPSPLQFNPNSIKDIAAADPAAGIDLIQPPTPNNRGTAELDYPIRLPRGRGSFSPRLNLTYSSASTNGWAGVGWELETPRVEIDTRWGVPSYESGPNQSRFLLNGAALVPIESDPRASCRASAQAQIDKQFAPRIETFQRVIRCKTSAATYWEVTAKDGTRFEYGTDDESRLSSYQSGESSNVAVWLLRRVVDTNNNATDYHYLTDSSAAIPNFQGEPFVQKYLKEIVYTSHPTRLPKYHVELLSDCSTRQDVIVSGRMGFKVLTRCRLSQINVRFENQLIRRYVLHYELGAFGKSLLSRLSVQGVDGSVFYEHSFEYTRPEFGESGGNAFDAAIPWPADPLVPENPPINDSASLITRTAESDHLLNFRAGFGFSVGMGQDSVGCDIGVSAGLNFGYPTPEIEHTDLNGDGIPDRLWLSGSGVESLNGRSVGFGGRYFGPSQGTAFSSDLDKLGSRQEIGGLFGVDGGCRAGPAGVGVGVSVSGRKSGASSLLIDADGDGQLDLAFGKGILSGLPRKCLDGTVPGSGQCADGLQICVAPNKYCFQPLQTQASNIIKPPLFAQLGWVLNGGDANQTFTGHVSAPPAQRVAVRRREH